MSTSSPLVRCPIASRLAERWMALLPGPLPVGDGLRLEPGLGVVMRQQLGLGLAVLGKLRLQHLRNALVILLPRALQQRLIGRVLDQGMLEDIRRLRRQPPLVEQLRLHELRRPCCNVLLVQGRHGLQQLIGKLPPSVAPSCATAFAVASRSSRAISESCSVAGIASGGSGPVSA